MKFLHTMIRVLDIERAVSFFELLGLREIRRKENEKGRFTLIFLATAKGEPEIELTHNWGREAAYTVGNNFGHLPQATGGRRYNFETAARWVYGLRSFARSDFH